MDYCLKTAKNNIKNVVRSVFSDKIDEFVNKSGNVIRKIILKGKSMDMDLSKIYGFAKALGIIKKKKNKKVKKLVLTMIIASILGLTIGYTYQRIENINANSFEEKFKIFIKNLNIDDLKKNPVIKTIRQEIKSIME